MKVINPAQMPFVESIRKYVSSERNFFCMPGHKQGSGAHQSLRSLWGSDFFRYDITEVFASDVLAEPTQSLALAQELAAQAFGTSKTWFLINGSSVGIIAALCAVLNPEDKILLSRSIHKSVVSGLTLSGAHPHYLSQKPSPTFAYGGVDLKDLNQKLAEIRPKAVFITSPNYYGLTPDIARIAECCHQHNSLLIVDEAHGAHFRFHPELPTSAIDGNADVVIHSAHKTFGALYQTAFLHLSERSATLSERISQSLAMLQTTSPSVPLLMSIDAARARFATDGNHIMGEIIALAESLRSAINRVGHIKTIDPPQSDLKKWGHSAYDKTRIIARFTPALGNARAIKDFLARSCQCETELADNKHILFTLAVGDFGKDLSAYQSTLKALKELPHRLPASIQTADAETVVEDYIPPQSPEVVLTPRSAWLEPSTTVKLSEAAGRISTATVCAYPPGTPLLVPGESVSPPLITHIQSLITSGARITGLQMSKNLSKEKIAVVA